MDYSISKILENETLKAFGNDLQMVLPLFAVNKKRINFNDSGRGVLIERHVDIRNVNVIREGL